MNRIRLASSADEMYLKNSIQAAYHEYPRLIAKGSGSLELAVERVLEHVASEGFAHVAEEGGKLLGISWWTPETDQEMAVAYYVEPEARNQGIATQLLKAGLQEAKSRGVRSTLIKTHPENAASISLARKVGFEPIVALLRQSL
ncbi:MAG: GNAT family N-acetyltransferase [Deinococcales bacterium]